MRKTVAFLLAGGMGSRLNVLGWMRAKPAAPFGGCYRLIDFTMSNAMHSGIQQIGILTQYRPYSLMGHIGAGEAWDLVGRSRCAKILPPSVGIGDFDWYRGTADAVAQNLDFARRYDAERILVLSGDHIYQMNYAPLIRFHEEKKAPITVAMMRVPWEETHHFGIGEIDKQQRIIYWDEKPEKAKSNLASMGIYVFDCTYLEKALESRSGHDFGKHILHDAIKSGQVNAYLFDGYWADVGTLKAYWQSNMEILDPKSGLNLRDWAVRTNYEEEGMRGDRGPAYLGPHAKIQNALLSIGCHVDGTVKNSILSPGVWVEKGAIVQDSVIMHDTYIGRNARLLGVIADKHVRIGTGARVGIGDAGSPNEKYPDHLYSGLTVIGKRAHVPQEVQIHPNSIVEPLVDETSFRGLRLSGGSYIRK